MRHNIPAERYEQTLEDYDRLLSREYDQTQDTFRAEHHPSLLTREDSNLDPEQLEILEELGFLPTIKTHSIMKDGTTIDSETWVDESGGTGVEFGVTPESMRCLHFVSSYFSDGTAITVFPGDSVTANSSSPVRTNIRGEDDLRADIATGLTARAERTATGVRPLLMVDVPTARLHQEFHGRFLHADPFEVVMANLDTSDLWKVEVRVSLWFLLIIAAFTLVFTLIFGHSETVYVGSGALALYALFTIGKAWWNRDKPRDPFPGMSAEDAEELVREMMEKRRKD